MNIEINQLQERIKELEYENSNLKKQLIGVRQSKELYLDILDGFPALVWRAGLDKLCNYFNKAWFDFTGRTPEQEYGIGWMEGVHYEDVNFCWQTFVTAFDKRQAFQMVYRLKNKLGEYCWIHDFGQPFYNLNNTFEGYIGFCYDITESKIAELGLKENKNKYKILFEYSAIPIWEEDFSLVKIYFDNLKEKGISDFRNYFDNHIEDIYTLVKLVKIVDINQTTTKFFDVKDKSDIIRDLHIYFSDVSYQILKEEFIALAEGKTYFECEIPIKSFDGEMKYIFLSLHVCPGYEHNLSKVFVSFVDLTERKLAEIELIAAKERAVESELKFRTLIEHAGDGFELVNSEGRFIDVNQATCNRLGYSKEEMLQKYVWEIVNNYSAEEFYRNFELYRAKPAVTFESEHIHKNGSIIPVEITISIIKLGKSYIRLTISRDISIQKQHQKELIAAKEGAEESEQKYKQIFDNTFDIMSIYEVTEDHRFKVITFNPAEAKLIGNVEYYQNRYIDECIPPELYNQFKQNYERCIREEKLIIYEEEISFQHINKTFHTQLIPLKNSLGRVHRIIVISNDITENKLLNTQLTNQNDELKLLNINLTIAKEKAEESDNLKTAFLRNISHEIRTPLNAITGFSGLIIQPNQPREKLVRFSNILTTSSHKLLEIITDVIEIAHLQSHLMTIKNTEFDFMALAKEIIYEYQDQIRNKGLEFIVYINPNLKDFNIISDKDKLYSILKHLIDNALKFTHSGSITLDFALSNEEIKFKIADTGIGILKEMQDVIFKPFRQVEIGKTRNYGGNGIGLALAKGFIELLKGTLKLQSEFNVGTTIDVAIPIQFNSTDGKLQKSSRKLHTKADSILIVEDEYSNSIYLAEMLQEFCTTILYASNGKQAIEMCRTEKQIELVFMDIKMPIMDGHTATKLIKAFRPDLPIIAQSAYALDIDKEKFLESGFDDYISKPIQPKLLYKTIEKYIIK